MRGSRVYWTGRYRTSDTGPYPMNTVIAIVNQKGGVGKTTTTVNLAFALSQLGQRVLVVDLDPQASLTVYAGLDVQALDAKRKTLYYGLVQDEPVENLITPTEHFDVLASSIRLSSGEAELVANPLAGPALLSNLIEPVKAEYDFVLIDCPPTLTLLTVNALAAADQVLIPVKTDFLSLMGLSLLLDSIKKSIDGSGYRRAARRKRSISATPSPVSGTPCASTRSSPRASDWRKAPGVVLDAGGDDRQRGGCTRFSDGLQWNDDPVPHPHPHDVAVAQAPQRGAWRLA